MSDPWGKRSAGTRVSAALGRAVAARRCPAGRRVVAILDDSVLTAGVTFEALNHAGTLPSDLLIILHDRDPLPGNGAALTSELARVLSGWIYTQLREKSKKVLRQMPTVWELARRSEQHLKGMVLPGTLFEELGINYFGPMDGRDTGALVTTLRNLKRLRGPQLLHVITRAAEGRTTVAMGPLPGTYTYSQVFGQWLSDMAEADPKIIGITTASIEDSGLGEFARRFPDRCFDLSSAYQHAVTFAAGLATEGFKPVVAIPATQLSRTYDQLIHDVALQKLPVVFAVDGAGVGAAGDTAQPSPCDLSYLRCIPNLTLMTPADGHECRQMLCTARALPGPALVRYPRAPAPHLPADAALTALPAGRAHVCREGRSGLALLVFGAPLAAARAAAEQLDATLASMRFVKPLDAELLAHLSAHHRWLVTIEENTVAGGAGSAVAEALVARGIRLPLLQLGLPERLAEHDSRDGALAAARLDAPGLIDSIDHWWRRLSLQPLRSASGS
jgi:1-deoxy-D-xylulose-5-phosphate synthase